MADAVFLQNTATERKPAAEVPGDSNLQVHHAPAHDEVAFLNTVKRAFESEEVILEQLEHLTRLNTTEAAEFLCAKVRHSALSTERLYYIARLGAFQMNPGIYRTLVREAISGVPQTAVAAVKALGQAHIFRAGPFLVGQLQRCLDAEKEGGCSYPSPELIESFGHIGGTYTAHLLADYFVHAPAELQHVIVLALGEIRCRDALPVLISALSSGRLSLQVAALNAFAILGMTEDLPKIEALLHAPGNTRLAPLIAPLRARIEANANMQIEQLVQELLSTLRETDMDDRIKQLRLFGEEQIAKVFDKLLQHQSPEIRSRALRMLRIAQRCPHLIFLHLPKEQHPHLRREAVQILGDFRVKEYLPFYQRLLYYESPTMKRDLLLAISKAENADMLPLLLDMLKEETAIDDRLECLRAIKNIALVSPRTLDSQRAAMTALFSALLKEHDDDFFRARLSWVIGELRLVDCLPALLQFAREERDYKHWVYWAIAQLATEHCREFLLDVMEKNGATPVEQSVLVGLVEARWQLPIAYLIERFRSSKRPECAALTLDLCQYATGSPTIIAEHLIGLYIDTPGPFSRKILRALLSSSADAERVGAFLSERILANDANMGWVLSYVPQCPISAEAIAQILGNGEISIEAKYNFAAAYPFEPTDLPKIRALLASLGIQPPEILELLADRQWGVLPLKKTDISLQAMDASTRIRTLSSGSPQERADLVRRCELIVCSALFHGLYSGGECVFSLFQNRLLGDILTSATSKLKAELHNQAPTEIHGEALGRWGGWILSHMGAASAPHETERLRAMTHLPLWISLGICFGPESPVAEVRGYLAELGPLLNQLIQLDRLRQRCTTEQATLQDLSDLMLTLLQAIPLQA